MKIIKVYKECENKEVKKYNPYHGADGRFTTAGGANGGKGLALNTSKKVSDRKELYNRLTKGVNVNDPNSKSYKDAQDLIETGGGKYSSPAQMMLDQIGYMDKPTKVSKEEFEKLAKKSPYGVIERGFNKENAQHYDDFINKKGPIDLDKPRLAEFTGTGGTYFKYGPEASKKAIFVETHTGATGPTLKAILHPDAKVTTYDSNMGWVYAANLDAKSNSKKAKSAKEKLYTKYDEVATDFKNRNIFAALEGYDALKNGDTLIVLNRGAVIIQE